MTIPRLQLVELEDLEWFPRSVRDYATDYLHFIETKLQVHRPAVPLLAAALRASGSRHIVDLCSGSSGPIQGLCADLRAQGLAVDITLTDRFPNLDAFARAREVCGGASAEFFSGLLVS